jgi:hypothetical protein
MLSWQVGRVKITRISGGFAPVSFPLFHGTRLWNAGKCIHLILHGHTPRLSCRGLGAGIGIRSACGPKQICVRLGSKRPVAIDPSQTCAV